MNAAIAQKLNVLESAIVRVEEWANVLFVVVKGLGARFVSKKVVKVMSRPVLKQIELAHWSFEADMLQLIEVGAGRKITVDTGNRVLTATLTSDCQGLFYEWGGCRKSAIKFVAALIESDHKYTIHQQLTADSYTVWSSGS